MEKMNAHIEAAWVVFVGLIGEIILGTSGLPAPLTVLALIAAGVVPGFRYTRVPLVAAGLILDAVLGRPAPSSVIIFAVLCPGAAGWLRHTDIRNPLPSILTGGATGVLYAVTAGAAARRVWSSPGVVQVVPGVGVIVGSGILGALLLPAMMKAVFRLHRALHGRPGRSPAVDGAA